MDLGMDLSRGPRSGNRLNLEAERDYYRKRCQELEAMIAGHFIPNRCPATLEALDFGGASGRALPFRPGVLAGISKWQHPPPLPQRGYLWSPSA